MDQHSHHMDRIKRTATRKLGRVQRVNVAMDHPYRRETLALGDRPRGLDCLSTAVDTNYAAMWPGDLGQLHERTDGSASNVCEACSLTHTGTRTQLPHIVRGESGSLDKA